MSGSHRAKGLLLAVSDRDISDLKAVLQQHLPQVPVYSLAEEFPVEAIEYAVLWKQPPGLLARLPALRGVSSLGAGVDFILNDPDLSDEMPVARIVAEDLKQQMAQYVAAVVTRFHRRFPEFEAQQKARHWQVLPNRPASQPVVGFAGFGQLGQFTGELLHTMGYRIASWTRKPNAVAEESYVGSDGLQKLAERSDFLVNLLPLTAATEGLFNRKVFSQMTEKQPVFIHVGRGPQVVEEDLLAALDAGQLAHAVMDVFNTEPLPADSPLWTHPKITITPHLAARSDAVQTARAIVSQWQAMQAGQPLPLQVDRSSQY